MENFFLWSVSDIGAEESISFCASPVHLQGIHQGTKKMIEEMLADLGARETDVQSWTIRHMVTDYMADDPEGESTEERYGDAWEITVAIKNPVSLQISEKDLISTWAMDATWGGSTAPFLLPAELVVIAKFANEESALQAEAVLARKWKVRRKPGLPTQLLISVGWFDEGNFDKGVKLAEQATKMTRSLGGLTTWKEMVS